MLVLAMLSQIAEEKQNVIFAMEEPETAIPPYAQKRIVHELGSLSSQTLFTSHSPFVLEEFGLEQLIILSRNNKGVLDQALIELPDSVKPKRFKQEFRTRFCEGLLARRILIAEGATETDAMPAAARRLSELNPTIYSPLESIGICILNAGTDSQIADLSELYKKLGKSVVGVCDKQSDEAKALIESKVDKLFMHEEKGIELMVLKNTKTSAINRFLDNVDWPPHLQIEFPTPKTDAVNALEKYFKWSKGSGGIAEFLYQCNEDEFPDWIKETCSAIQTFFQPEEQTAKEVVSSDDQGTEDVD